MLGAGVAAKAGLSKSNGSSARASVTHAGHQPGVATPEPHDHGPAGDGHPSFRRGQVVDHEANGFHPAELLHAFDHGKTRRLASGRVLREWELVAQDKEIEVAPGVGFPAW